MLLARREHAHAILYSPESLLRILVPIASGLLGIYLVTQIFKYVGGHDYQLGLERLFNLGLENNIPTWYASATLLLCSGMLAMIATGQRRLGDRYAGHWLGLGIIFLYLSLDEAASIHELLSTVLEDAWHTSGFLTYAWVIPAGVLTFLIALSYLRFIAALPRTSRRRFVTAGGLYVGGALYVEAVAAKYDSLYGVMNLPYACLVALEEGLEMYGVVVFAYGLASHIASHMSNWSIALGRSGSERRHAWESDSETSNPPSRVTRVRQP